MRYFVLTQQINRSLNNNPGEWDRLSVGKVRVAALNIARLQPHMADLSIDPTMLKADLIHLCETWVSQDLESMARFELEGFTAHFINVGNGRGIATYSRGDFHHRQDVKEENFQITKFGNGTLDSIHIYR